MANECKEILKKERKILHYLTQCPFITRLRCTIYNHKKYQGWLAYDFFLEPEWDSIIPSLSIDDIKSYVYQLLSGVEFCHKQGIVHRNISWDSLFLGTRRKQLLIGGWQHALFHADVHPLESEVKMPYFKSPERLLNETSRNCLLQFDFPVDMWSVGCVLGCLIFRKKYMFDGVDWRMIVLNIEAILGSKAMLDFAAKYDIEYNFIIPCGFERATGMDLKELITERNRKVATNEAIDLLKNLIVIDPAHRFTANEALYHDFFKSLKESSTYAQLQRRSSTVHKYKIGKQAGFGLFSRVYKILEINKTEKGKVYREFAAKHVLDGYTGFAEKEVKALEHLRGCPNIIQLHGVLEKVQFKYDYIFMEYFEGETLDVFHFPTLEELRFYFYQLLVALKACHSHGIMHRDVKPANVLINYRTKQLRLIDFGLAEFYTEGVRYDCTLGALRYKAPELYLGHEYYNYAVDMWAFGVIFASCIFKRNIFDQPKPVIYQIMRILGTSRLLDYIVKLGDAYKFYWQFSSTNYPIISWNSFVNDKNRDFATEDALDFIDKSLVYDYERRLKVEQAMEHPFFYPYSTSIKPNI
ncbi:unnamed protein product [Hymenolepis diminuta]|uniref:non-specific serine/threonine protein kinase n=1 Tax=Hymenolepis diminuta TaxID=6216 RepID=A0A0R3STZ8_HYMDI|nr:unnamed protein product [Hymenolepis diminuta]